MKSLFILVSWIGLALCQNIIDKPSVACDSKFFCDGEILRKIQLSEYTKDNKEFVDMATARPEKEVLEAFKKLPDNPSEAEYNEFISTNFHAPGKELESVTLENYPEFPSKFTQMKNQNMRNFAKDIHAIWGKLLRRYNPKLICEECQSSLLPLKHNFIIPGGRFREFYYWDSYFVMVGLHHSNLQRISKDMLMNFGDFVETYGLIPNGARRYFLNRSQPPLYIPAMDNYIEKTKDFDFLKKSIQTLEKEYNYWLEKHSIPVKCPEGYSGCALTRYIVDTDKPRPESYREDLHIVEGKGAKFNPKEIKQKYADIAAGAETGWDYSTRWIPNANKLLNKTEAEMLRGIQTSNIIPVDLNSIMYLNEITLAKFYSQLANKTISGSDVDEDLKKIYKNKAESHQKSGLKRAATMQHIMWNPTEFSFYDYNIMTKQQNRWYTSSNFWPFWADSLTPEFRNQPNNYLNAFKKLDNVIKNTPGGTPVTLLNSTLQWDLANSWAPLEYILVEGLRKSAIQAYNPRKCTSPYLKNLARKVAEKFVQATYCAWSQTGKLYEKYGVDLLGKVGGGGEYIVQSGFGWTNGVVLHFLSIYPDIQPSTHKCFELYDLESKLR